ncbi:MAG: TIGR03086 family metal-binding protein [Kineosporiaceae bacterium]
MALPEDPAQRHRVVAGAFTDLVLSADPRSWDASSPVAGWTARDVVRHLTDWLPALLASSAGIDLTRGPSVDEDPAAAWTTQVSAVQALLDDPAAASRMLTNPHLGEAPVGATIDRIYTSDVFMHRWDLGRALGRDVELDADTCAAMVEGMEQIDELLRSSGQYGPRVEVPEGSDPQTRLIGFIGRDPFWTAPEAASA